jgi:hypothetical protein
MSNSSYPSYPTGAEPLDDAAIPAPPLALQAAAPHVEITVHDASRLAWHTTIPLPEAERTRYTFELEVEAPANLVGAMDPWAALQSYARLDAATDAGAELPRSIGAFRRAVVAVSSKLARARDGFVRHCTSIRASAVVEDEHARPLLLWLGAASTELANARAKLLARGGARAPVDPESEEILADEFLSGQLWAIITDCGRALQETRRALEERAQPEPASLDGVEAALAAALKEELAYRRASRFGLAEPVNVLQLERLLSRMRWLKKHFERVLFLDVESYQVVSRLAGWSSAFIAMLAYLWFLFWQLAIERHPAAVGSGVIAFALLTAAAYASRERLKEIGRNWLAGRIQRMFAQRVTRYRLPLRDRTRGDAWVLSARESFSQSSAQRPDPVHPECGATHDVSVLRFAQRGMAARPAGGPGNAAPQVRLIYRLDMSALFPRLHDAVRGLASFDERSGTIAIVDVPRNYELPVRAALRWSGGEETLRGTLVLSKNGLLRFDEDEDCARERG